VRNIIVLLLLALTFAAAIRPGVEWLRRKKVPDGLSILVFFVLGLGVFVLFFWLALPPASHELRGVLLVLAVGLPQSLHTAGLAIAVLIAVREFQSYVINPRLMGGSVGLSPLVTLVTVSVVGLLFGAFAVILAIPAVSAAATLIDVLVLGHEPPSAPLPRKHGPLQSHSGS